VELNSYACPKVVLIHCEIYGDIIMPQPERIVAINTPNKEKLIDNLEGGMKKYFSVCKEKIGFIPNVLLAYAFRPEKLKNFVSFYNFLMLGESSLSKLDREMIAVVVSSANHCYYCIVAHSQAVRELSGDPELAEMLCVNYRVANLGRRERTMLDFADKLTVDPKSMHEDDRNALRKEGFSEEGIFDIADTAAFFNMTNRMASSLDMMPNPEYLGRNRESKV